MTIKNLFFIVSMSLLISPSSKGDIFIRNLVQPENETHRIIKEDFIKKYESNNYIKVYDLKDMLIQCNPRIKSHGINKVIKDGYLDYCLNKSYFFIKTSTGTMKLKTVFSENKEDAKLQSTYYKISSGVQLSKSLSQLNILQFNFYFLPNFTVDDSNKKIRLSTMYSFDYIFQQRIRSTDLSTRFGVQLEHFPTIDLKNKQLKKKDFSNASLILGLKYSPSRNKAARHMLFLDYHPMILSEKRENDIHYIKNYSINFKHSYHFSRFLSAGYNAKYSYLSISNMELTYNELGIFINFFPY